MMEKKINWFGKQLFGPSNGNDALIMNIGHGCHVFINEFILRLNFEMKGSQR